MSITFDRNNKQKIKEHLQSVVSLAKVDGYWKCKEINVVKKIAEKFEFGDSDFKNITESDHSYDPPEELCKRYEFLYCIYNLINEVKTMSDNKWELFKLTALSLNFNYKKIEEIFQFFNYDMPKYKSEEDPFPVFENMILNKNY